MTNKKSISTINVKTGANMDALIEYAVQRSIEKSQRESLPNLTASDLNNLRKQGVHQGAWEVIVKLLERNQNCAVAVLSVLKPNMEYIHEFDWENLSEYFGSIPKSKEWIMSLIGDSSPLDALSENGADVVAKKGDRIESDIFLEGRDYGIAEALFEAYLLDESSTYEVMCLDLCVAVEKVHPLTMAKTIYKCGDAEAFKSFLNS